MACMKAGIGANEQAVLDVLRQQHRALSAYDILDRLHGSKVRAAVQVYRAADKLAQRGLVHRIESLNAFVACDCAHGKSSPGFMLCTCCGDVREFDARHALSAVKSRAKGFRVERPSVELKGLCINCQREGHSHAVHDEVNS
jgi:Fur family zinc uptake transcriptional regulator